MAFPSSTPTPNPGTTGGGSAAKTVAGGNPGGATPPASASSALPPNPPPLAKSSVIPFGGKRGGRSRLDGLVPGSPEAREADLQKDRERKARAAALKEAALRPPVLPSAVAPPQPQPGTSPTTPGAGLVPVPLVVSDAWTPQEAQPLVIHGLPVAEHILTHRRLVKMREAKLPAHLIQQIRSDSAWPQTAKDTLHQSLPAPTAKLLNALHVPKAFKDEISSIPALALLIQHQMDVDARLDRLIEEWKKESKQAAPAKETKTETRPPTDGEGFKP